MATKTTYNAKQENALLDLFHVYPSSALVSNISVDASILAQQGILFLNENGELIRGLHGITTQALCSIMERFGCSNLDWSKSFHKSWEKVATTPMEQLVFEQLVHYFSTYGMEDVGLKAMPLLPVERVLADPDTVPNVQAFTIIRLVNDVEIVVLINNYLRVAATPHRSKMDGIASLMYLTNIPAGEIKSFELRCIRYGQHKIVPSRGDEFLRYVSYLATGSTLFIKSNRAIKQIKNVNDEDVKRKVSACFAKADLVELSKVFLRHKNLILAFKQYPDCAAVINKIRRMAVQNHHPLPDVSVQNFTKLMQEGRVSEAQKVVKGCSNRQLIKLVNALNVQGGEGIPRVFNVRNGRLFVRNGVASSADPAFVQMLVDELGSRFAGKLEGKTFYLPQYVDYAVPVSEKQFVGNVPYGSRISLDAEAFCAAVYWENHKGERTDLDLHMQSPTKSFGWNSGWRDSDVLYSGDVTDAANGAVEAYRFRPEDNDMYILTLNNFTSNVRNPAFKFFVTNSESAAVCDVKDALFTPIPLNISEGNAMTLGLFHEKDFVFYGGALGEHIVPTEKLYYEFLTALINRTSAMLQMSELIKLAGGKLIRNETELDALDMETLEQVVDLSPSALTATTLLELVD